MQDHLPSSISSTSYLNINQNHIKKSHTLTSPGIKITLTRALVERCFGLRWAEDEALSLPNPQRANAWLWSERQCRAMPVKHVTYQHFLNNANRQSWTQWKLKKKGFKSGSRAFVPDLGVGERKGKRWTRDERPIITAWGEASSPDAKIELWDIKYALKNTHPAARRSEDATWRT